MDEEIVEVAEELPSPIGGIKHPGPLPPDPVPCEQPYPEQE